MGDYASTSDVQARIPYRTIASSTSPSTTDVDTWIAEAEALLNGTLAASGLPGPYSDASAVAILRSWVLDYPEGRVREAYAAAGGDGTNTDGQKQVERFEERLEWIRKNPGDVGAMLAAGTAPSSATRISSYWTDNTDGKSVSGGDFVPTFGRGDAL